MENEKIYKLYIYKLDKVEEYDSEEAAESEKEFRERVYNDICEIRSEYK